MLNSFNIPGLPHWQGEAAPEDRGCNYKRVILYNLMIWTVDLLAIYHLCFAAVDVKPVRLKLDS